jgi:hypothetical protein
LASSFRTGVERISGSLPEARLLMNHRMDRLPIVAPINVFRRNLNEEGIAVWHRLRHTPESFAALHDPGVAIRIVPTRGTVA